MVQTNELKKIDSVVLSNYILKHYGPMSHLKLQKLLFYCDAYCLAYFHKELVDDKFEAWAHGPVSRKVFDQLKGQAVLYTDVAYSETPGIDVDKEFDGLASTQKELICNVLGQLSKWSGLELEMATHRELPWQAARQGCSEAEKCHVEIDKELTAKYYVKELVDA